MGTLLATFDWQHALLLGGAIFGGVLVGVGILKESEKWSAAAILVLIGVIIEPIFTIGLFLYDESLSRAQQSKIIALSARVLTKDQYDAIQTLRGVVTDIGILYEPGCLECSFLASEIETAFHDAGARLYGTLDPKQFSLGQWTGIMLFAPPDDAPSLSGPIAKVLADSKLLGGVMRADPRRGLRTDIPVLVVGERFAPFSEFPYFPSGSHSWQILPIAAGSPNVGAANAALAEQAK